mgnify:CR=1 FL=1|tara:strand:- start:361 stop:504 length:144 start_codon:yes stop_codon:yes gene_type:complete
MRMRRYHQFEVARYYQRLENDKRRKREAEAKKKKGFLRKLLTPNEER